MSRRVFAIIPAAGQGRRMGQLKQLMPYGEGTMLDAVMDAILEAPIDGLALVTNSVVAERFEDNPEDGLFIEINDDEASEMIDSVRIGLDKLDEEFDLAPADGILVLPGDQPEIRGGIIATCAESYRLPRIAPGILIATYKGQRGHPAIFRTELLREIETWDDDRGLNALAKLFANEVRELPITTSAMPIDVNTPEDYERLKDK
ncbi:MAG: nucleotidyltransferase family protein [Planctomycetes bacterium]|nr:nucleotidyltransferase family protein [Planctomycetota bacterium]